MWRRAFQSKFGLLSAAGACLLAASAHAEIARSTISVLGQHFATDTAFAPRVSLLADIHSEDPLTYNEAIPRREFHLYSFFETDARTSGDYSLDADTMVARIDLSGPGHLWIGRTHPLSEGTPELAPSSTSAIGANWAQNGSDALTPRVSGWIGAGGHVRHDSGFFATAAYSPLYLPSFGPTLNLSENEEARGSRFAKLPPLYFNLNNELLPMRYSVQVGSIKDILLQDQYFLSVGHGNGLHRLTFLHWSAPSPNPSVTSFGQLRVSEKNGVKVLVTAVPSFPRQSFWGTRWQVPGLYFAPDLGAVYEAHSRRWTLSAAIDLPLIRKVAPFARLQAGWLHTIHRPEELAAMTSGPVQSAEYARSLLWGEITFDPVRAIRPSLRVEQHLTSGQEGIWLRPTLAFGSSRFTVLATADIIAGQDTPASYFGTWRSLDSFSLGARYQW